MATCCPTQIVATCCPTQIVLACFLAAQHRLWPLAVQHRSCSLAFLLPNTDRGHLLSNTDRARLLSCCPTQIVAAAPTLLLRSPGAVRGCCTVLEKTFEVPLVVKSCCASRLCFVLLHGLSVLCFVWPLCNFVYAPMSVAAARPWMRCSRLPLLCRAAPPCGSAVPCCVALLCLAAVLCRADPLRSAAVLCRAALLCGPAVLYCVRRSPERGGPCSP